MSTSDQQGNAPLTRKQLREIRRTGATPVTIPEESTPETPASQEPAPAPAPAPPAEQPREEGVGDGAPLTRRQMRERERSRTESVPVVTPAQPDAEDAAAPPSDEAVVPSRPAAEAPPADESAGEAASDAGIVSSVPGFAPRPEQNVRPEPEPEAAQKSEPEAAQEPEPESLQEPEPARPVEPEPGHDAALEPGSTTEPETPEDDALSLTEPAEERPESLEERPVVNPAFGQGILAEPSDARSFPPSFDELIASDSTGSQHVAPNTLIFTPAPGDGSLSGPVASTGEVLITGSYELPAGLGSQGHADGAADGRDIDAVLIDGELPAASSPTPIAASAAVSTIKPAGEVIRPPAPDKGNRLMMTLAITAGGLALALAVALIIAFTTNVLG